MLRDGRISLIGARSPTRSVKLTPSVDSEVPLRSVPSGGASPDEGTRTLNAVLQRFDEQQRDGRRCILRKVLDRDGGSLVFIRRPHKATHQLVDNRVVHGNTADWIVLEFRNEGKLLFNLSLARPDLVLYELCPALVLPNCG
jgi:hypothetical protein